MPNLSCYLLKPPPPAHDRDYLWFVNPTERVSLRTYTPAVPNLDAALFVPDSFAHPPAWAAFLADGFPGVEVPTTRSPRALLIVAPPVGHDHYLAFAFGAGRFLLKNDTWVRGFGLRAALNVVCGDSAASSDPLIRSIDAKRLQATVISRRHQSSRSVPIETLDIDIARDFLRSVHGEPADDKTWGSKVGGTHALHLSLREFSELPAFTNRVLDLVGSTQYRKRFKWVDRFQPVDAPDTQERVEQHILSLLTSGSTDNLGFAPPDILDLDAVAGFGLSFETRSMATVRPYLDTPFLLSALRGSKKLANLSVAQLRNWTVRAVDPDGALAGQPWSIWDCLSASFDLDGHTYVLDDGALYDVSGEYLRGIDAYLDTIPRWLQRAPSARPSESEDGYLERLCSSDSALTKAHSRNVRIESQSTPIELCDVIHGERREFIHLKRHFTSSTISHLLNQGFVSADLMLRDAQFRDAVALLGLPGIDVAGFQARDFTVVYGIIGPWNGEPPSRRLPFFSKLTAHSVLQSLEAMGYAVALACVGIQAP